MNEANVGALSVMNTKKNLPNYAKKENKGITLIALIITIIVLLILAVVAIREVQGDGIISKAKKAKEDYENAQVKEQGILDQYLAQIEGTVGNNSTGGNGEITVGAINTQNYGKKVIGYTSKGEGLGTLVWRVFYEDKNNVYLISETADGDYPVNNLSFYTDSGKKDIVEKYNSGADVSVQGKALMPKASRLFTSSNINENIIATAYLCDTEVWDAYTDAAGKAAWAMGSPTIELFAESYNACSLGNTIELVIKSDGYTHNTSRDWFTTSQKNGIYRLNSSGWCWLISPSNASSSCITGVDNSTGDFYRYSVSFSGSARPVVCIPRSNFLYELVD